MTHYLEVLLAALGEEHPSQRILDAIVEIGEGFVESPSVTPGDYYFEFFTKGVAFNFRRNCLRQISIYCQPTDQYSANSLSSNLGLSNNASKAEVLQTFGTPAQTRNEETSQYLGRINSSLRYFNGGSSMTFEFDHSGKIFALHLSKLN